MQILLPILACWLSSPAQPSAQPDRAVEHFAVALAKGVYIIEQEHIKPSTKRQLIQWAIEALYKEVDEPMPADLAKRMQALKEAEEIHKFLIDARGKLGKNKRLENRKDVEICFDAIFAQLEPARKESAYIPEGGPFGFPPFPRALRGVGLQIEIDDETKMLRVVTPILNGPAYKAGIRAGDIITHIHEVSDDDGKLLTKPIVHSTKGMSRERAVELLLGENGSAVRLSVIPAGKAKGASQK